MSNNESNGASKPKNPNRVGAGWKKHFKNEDGSESKYISVAIGEKGQEVWYKMYANTGPKQNDKSPDFVLYKSQPKTNAAPAPTKQAAKNTSPAPRKVAQRPAPQPESDDSDAFLD